MDDNALTTVRGLTTADAARLLRVSEDKIRFWIKSGEISAINTARVRSGKPRFVILPHALEQFASARSPAEPPKLARSRKQKTNFVDYFP